MSYIFPHNEVLQEESMSATSLPADIQDMIEDFNELKAEYDQAPSEEGLDELRKESVKIADEIQDFLEEGMDDDENDNFSSEKNVNNSGKANWRFW